MSFIPTATKTAAIRFLSSNLGILGDNFTPINIPGIEPNSRKPNNS